MGRTIFHLEIKGEEHTHYYFGGLKAMFDFFNYSKEEIKEKIGIQYSSLKNYGISESKLFENDKVIIRKGILISRGDTIVNTDSDVK